MANNELLGDDSKTTQKVILCKTSYHYWRFGISELLQGTGAKFKKAQSGWQRIIIIDWHELDIARKLLINFKENNPDTKEMWW